MSLDLDQLCTDAMRRIQKHINAAAGQHLRAIRKDFARAQAVQQGGAV